ncbi:hypothetical protein ACFL5S_00675 [Fibrobacterota bacterium]
MVQKYCPQCRYFKNVAAIILIWVIPIVFSAQPAASNYTYSVVISEAAYADGEWKEVADALLTKHDTYDARMFKWSNSVTDVKSQLSEFMPRYIGFIAMPVSECNAAFVATVSRMTRGLDSDPYGDAYWGIITGYEAADALRAII